MADRRRFGRSEREYTGVPRRGLSNNQRFGRSERAYTGVTDRTGGKYDRFGPSEKRYSEARYTPSGKGTTWGFTGDFRRKIPGYDVGSRPPRGLASLIPRKGMIGQDPRSSTYSAPWNLYQTGPDDLRGYRASVADVAAANAEEERKRLNDQWRYDLTSPGSGIGLESQEFGIPAGMNEYLGVEDWLGAVPKDPRDVGTLGDFESKYGHYRDTSNMGDYRRSVADATAISGYDMPDRAKRNLSLLTDLDRMGTDAYRFANTAPVSIGERESGDVDWGGLGDDLRNSPTGFSGQTGEYNYGKLNKGLMNTGNLPAEMMLAEALDPNVALDILGDPNRNMDSILQIYGDDSWDNLPAFKIGDKWYGNPALGMPGKMGSGWTT